MPTRCNYFFLCLFFLSFFFRLWVAILCFFRFLPQGTIVLLLHFLLLCTPAEKSQPDCNDFKRRPKESPVFYHIWHSINFRSNDQNQINKWVSIRFCIGATKKFDISLLSSRTIKNSSATKKASAEAETFKRKQLPKFTTKTRKPSALPFRLLQQRPHPNAELEQQPSASEP